MQENISILYVDDDFLNLMSFEILLKDKFVIFTAPNAIKALEIFEKNDISVIISDQKMPNMSGVKLLEKVANEKNNTLRIIHSGYLHDEKR